MTDQYAGPFGTYADVTTIIASTSASSVATIFTNLLAMIPDPTAGASAPHPDFDVIPPATATALRAEITAAAAAVAAAPTS